MIRNIFPENVYPLPGARLANLPGNIQIQGTFQVCPIYKIGLLTFTGAFGVGTVELPAELGEKLLEYLPEHNPPK